MQFTQVKKILKTYTSKKTQSKLDRDRQYLSEIFLELEGINDLVKEF